MPEMFGFNGEYPAVNPKVKFWRFSLKNCKISVVKNSIEKPILLNFMNLSLTFCPRLYIEISHCIIDPKLEWCKWHISRFWYCVQNHSIKTLILVFSKSSWLISSNMGFDFRTFEMGRPGPGLYVDVPSALSVLYLHQLSDPVGQWD